MTFQPAKLPHVSPTTADKLRACPLRVAFDTNRTLRATIITGSAARLGIVCHRVLQAVGRGAIGVDADWDTAFAALWDREIAAQEQAVAASPHERHLGRARYWPQYSIRRARVKQLAFQLSRRGRRGIAREERPRTLTEQGYVAFNGQMVGTVDVVRVEGGEVIIEDYKTGTITQIDATTGSMVARDDYIQQILLYAAMYHDQTKTWPTRGRLIPLDGDPIEISIDPVQASRAAHDALDALRAYNTAVDQGRAPEQFARPSPASCQSCPYKGACTAIWHHIDTDWTWNWHTVEGVISVVEQRPDGTIMAAIHVERGSVSKGLYNLRASKVSEYLQRLINLEGCWVRITDLELSRNMLIATGTSIVWHHS